MPLEELQEWLDAANRIEARERLALVADLQAGSGTLKKGETKRHVRHLERALRDARPLDSGGAAELRGAGLPMQRAKGKRVRMVGRG